MDISQFFTATDLFGIVPEIILTVTALSVLTLEMAHIFQPRIILIVAALGLLLAGSVVIQTSGDEQILFGGMLALNQYSTFFDFLYIFIGLMTLIFSQGYLEKRGVSSRGEYPALILFAVIGMMLMTRANDLVIVFLGLELLSLSLYVLVGFLRHDQLSNESGLKYLLLGAFSTGFFLLVRRLLMAQQAQPTIMRLFWRLLTIPSYPICIFHLGLGCCLLASHSKLHWHLSTCGLLMCTKEHQPQ